MNWLVSPGDRKKAFRVSRAGFESAVAGKHQPRFSRTILVSRRACSGLEIVGGEHHRGVRGGPAVGELLIRAAKLGGDREETGDADEVEGQHDEGVNAHTDNPLFRPEDNADDVHGRQ